MTLIDAAIDILSRTMTSMTIQEIWEKIKEMNLFQSNGKTPQLTLSTEMIVHCQGVDSSRKRKEIYFYREESEPYRYGLIDWLDDDGTEKEINVDITKPYDVSKIDIVADKFTVEYIVKKIKIGELKLNPDFQRNEVWNNKQKSRLIESILIKIPIPTFYIDGRDEDKWIVVDGLQRLSTVYHFMDKKSFSISDLEFLKELEGLTFDKLDRKFQRRIEEYQLHFYIIRPNTPEKIAFNIFTRINTLGSPLSSQEIRHALHLGPATVLLKELSNTQEFINAIGLSTLESMRRRMNDRELILRLLAFKVLTIESYKDSLNDFLIDTMKQINTMDISEITEIKNYFKESMIKAKIVFKENAFRKIGERKMPISKPLFETFGNILVDYDKKILEEHRKKIQELFKSELSNNIEYYNSISYNTNNIRKIRYRFENTRKIIEEGIGKKNGKNSP